MLPTAAATPTKHIAVATELGQIIEVGEVLVPTGGSLVRFQVWQGNQVFNAVRVEQFQELFEVVRQQRRVHRLLVA